MARKVKKRAQLLQVFHSQETQGTTLQEYLEQALPASLNLDRTQVVSAQYGAVRLNEPPTPSAKGGLRLKIVGHAPGELATTVPQQLSTARAPEGALPAPPTDSFKNCDFFLIVKDDWIMGFGDHMRAESMTRYLRELLVNRLSNAAHAAMWTKNVFRYDAASQISEEGVRALKFDASLSAAAVDTLENEGFRGRVRQFAGGLVESLDAVLNQDVDANELADVHVAVSISVKNGVHGSDLANSAVNTAASRMLSTELEHPIAGIDATIETKQGNRVSLSEATVGKYYTLNRRQNENSVVDLEAWTALEDFHGHVESLGALQT